ncbi:TNF receptor-associated factor 3-like [Anneissia japonica]|uniref:TNF receptor-associated factor 3-like n=1 Tax=Anneissia japonica TaxID=1529436 RepID=UPI001425B4D6|nr:TNF receptor-associated factor 3-like [Anneissia japonica]
MSSLASTSMNEDGLDYTFVEGNVSDDLTCGVCLLAVRRAVQAPCGFRFCEACIKGRTPGCDGGENLLCSNCEEKFAEEEIAPDHHARRKMSKAKIYCPHKDRGCSETFTLKELGRHLEFCNYFPVACMHRSRGCATKLPRKDLQRHLETECEHRSVECTFCKSPFPHRDVEAHRRSCPKFTVTCPNDCGADDIRREELRTHLDERCSRQKRCCKFEFYGCDFKGVNAELEKHAEEGVQSHLDMTVMVVARCNAELSGAVSKVAELKSQMDIQLRKFGRLDELESRVEADHQKNEELAKQIASIKLTHKSKDDRLGKLQKLLARQADTIATLENTAKKDRKANEDIRRTVDSMHGSTTALTKKVEEMGAVGGTGGRGGGILRGPAQQQISNMQKEMDIQSYDALLKWPFDLKVTMLLLDQNDGKLTLSDSFKPDPRSSSFKRPTGDMNIASGCTLFASQVILKNPVYVKDDTMFLKMIVDTTGLYV